MDALTLFMVLLLGMTLPIAAIVIVVLLDVAVVAWMAIHQAIRGLPDVGHAVRAHWTRAAHT